MVKFTFKKLKAFTLIEIMVVLGILGILTGTAFLSVPKQLARARDGRRKSDLQMVSRVLEGVYDINDSYPGTLPDCGESFKTGETEWMDVPCDPKSKGNYYFETENDEGGAWFRLYTNLEREDDQSIVWAKCQGGCGPDCEYNYGVSSSNINLEVCLPPIVQYVCAPGGGKEGFCEAFFDPEISECPRVFVDDPTCNDQCEDNEIRCKNAKGKHRPDQE